MPKQLFSEERMLRKRTEEYISVEEAAGILGIEVKELNYIIRRGKIINVELRGREIFLLREEVIKMRNNRAA